MTVLEQRFMERVPGLLHDLTEAINGLAERMPVMRVIEKPKDAFPITSVSREDLEAKGFDVSEVDDATMERLASKMADDYCEQLFWTSMEIIAEYMDIPKKDEEEEDEDE